MARKKLLLLLKPFDIYQLTQSSTFSRITKPLVFRHLDNRLKVHKESIKFCQEILQKKSVDCDLLLRSSLSQPICNVDLVVTIGGDGTLLHASHFLDDKTPVLGVNSDPTQAEEVEEFSNQFDATRSTGYLCAATVKNFEQVIDDILNDRTLPSMISRTSVRVNSKLLWTSALNDVLVAHPSPAAVSRFSFTIKKDDQSFSPLVHSRSSGLRVSTAAGSTASMLSAGGFAMPILSRDLQYMVREPISPGVAFSGLMHGILKSDKSMDITWLSKEGSIYIDGTHVFHSIQNGDIIELSVKAPVLKVYVPRHLYSSMSNND